MRWDSFSSQCGLWRGVWGASVVRVYVGHGGGGVGGYSVRVYRDEGDVLWLGMYQRGAGHRAIG